MSFIHKLFNLKGILENIKMSVLLKMIQMVIKQISPELKMAILGGLKKWKVQAAQSSNPWDDLIVNFLLFLVGEE